MAAPKGISKRVESILDKEAARLELKADGPEGLSEQDLERMKTLLTISKILTGPSALAEGEPGELDAMVDALSPARRDPSLFPKRGPKTTSKLHEPADG